MNVPPPQALQANYRIANVSAVASAMMLIACFFDVSTSIGFTTLLALAYLRWRRRWMRVLLFCFGLCNLMLWFVALGGLSYIFESVETGRGYWEAWVTDEPRPVACYIQRYGECSGFDIPCSLAGATAFTGPHAQCSASCGVDNNFPTTCKERMKSIAWLCGPVLLFLASSVLILLATTWLSSTNAPLLAPGADVQPLASERRFLQPPACRSRAAARPHSQSKAEVRVPRADVCVHCDRGQRSAASKGGATLRPHSCRYLAFRFDKYEFGHWRYGVRFVEVYRERPRRARTVPSV
jgi:hypothetical protein